MYKILIIEDDTIIAEALCKHLSSWGFNAVCVEDLSKVQEAFIAFDPQLVLMDIGLPFFNGYHWCAEIRKLSKVPVIFISSADDKMDIIMAMNMGGDDYMTKPFDMQVLTSKIQAMLRRTYEFGSKTADIIEHGGGFFNISNLTLTVRDTTIELTKNEGRILQTLLENKGKIVSRDTLMTKLWQTDSYVDENTLSVNVGRLRRKLEELGLWGFIETKKGTGYIIQ
ncbi:MAG: response regulator transcription factor [Defluviitaleaceae bacterium]|nr:response regulator transcription factor [Defluviitaleaceae bacterium]